MCTNFSSQQLVFGLHLSRFTFSSEQPENVRTAFDVRRRGASCRCWRSLVRFAMSSDGFDSIDAHCGTNSSVAYCWTSAWAISSYCNAAAFVFGATQIGMRTVMAKKASTRVTMHKSSSTYSVKRGRTRLIAEMLTVSFLFRGAWCFMKGAPGEPWACFNNSVDFPDQAVYGDWRFVRTRAMSSLTCCVRPARVDLTARQHLCVQLPRPIPATRLCHALHCDAMRCSQVGTARVAEPLCDAAVVQRVHGGGDLLGRHSDDRAQAQVRRRAHHFPTGRVHARVPSEAGGQVHLLSGRVRLRCAVCSFSGVADVPAADGRGHEEEAEEEEQEQEQSRSRRARAWCMPGAAASAIPHHPPTHSPQLIGSLSSHNY